jgi:hypothetical protein
VRVSVEAVLPSPPARAWEVLVRWEEQARWMADVRELRVLSPHRQGLGVRIAVRTAVLGVPLFTDVLEVVAWDPPRLLRVEHLGAVRGTGEWRLEPAGEATRLRWTEDVRLALPLLGPIALLAYRPILARLMRRGLGRLQPLVRSEAT